MELTIVFKFLKSENLKTVTQGQNFFRVSTLTSWKTYSRLKVELPWTYPRTGK